MKKGAAAALGLIIAFIGQFIAFAMTGAGHGWITPFWFSAILWIAYPFVLIRTVNVFLVGKASMRTDWAVLAVAFAADAMLVWMTYREGVEYFHKLINIGDGIAELWIAIWVGWQGAALVNVLRAAGYFGGVGYADPLGERD